jgi:hypothetical protein
MTLKLDRRTFLRGLGGVTLALPVLECMLNGNGTAYAQSANPLPKRYAIVFAGQSLGGDGWARDHNVVAGVRTTQAGHFIVPATAGAGWEMTTPLEPLAALRSEFSIVSGMAIPFSRTSVDASAVPVGGAFRDFHGGGSGPLLCGTRSLSAEFMCRSISSDQAIANLTPKGQTLLPSLVLRAQPSWYLSGSSYSGRQYISYADGGKRIESQTSPQIAYRSLFTGFTPSDSAEKARFDFNRRARRSVLDLITRKESGILARVGAADRIRLERHFAEIRALEQRIDAIPSVTGGACVVPADPGADSPIGGDNAGSGSDSIATNTGYSNEDARARLMADLVHMAFVCDLTRSATLQITTFQSHMNVLPVTEALGLPIRADLHEAGHNGDQNNRGQLPVSTCLKWHVGIYAHLVQKLKESLEGGSPLLDQCAIVFVPEGGHGVQLNDGTTPFQTHSVEDMVMLVAGRAGGLRPGKHIPTGGAHPASCLVSAMQGAGYPGDTLGEVKGRVAALFG